MSFKMKYEITPKYLTSGSKRRSGIKMQSVKFIVAHDTGNPNSTALGNVNYYENSRNEMSASAHIFLDDKAIIECIPALTGTPEKAWHVLYNKTKDNEMYGDDANDIAIGVEYAYGDKINSNEAYKRYIWIMAYICYKFNLNPSKSIVGHCILDPERKSDPKSGLAKSGRTYEQLLKDVVTEYADCTKAEVVATPKPQPTPKPPVVTSPNKVEEDDQLEKVKIILTKNNSVVEGFMKENTNYVSVSDLVKLGLIKATWDNTNKKLYIS